MHSLKKITQICDINICLAYLFHPLNGWMRLPNMYSHRVHMMCGVVTNKDGNKKIVLAGGYGG